MGAASGRADALVFMGGLVAGVWVFAETWIALEGFVTSGELESPTLADLLGVPFWAVALALIVVAIATFALVQKFEATRKGDAGR